MSRRANRLSSRPWTRRAVSGFSLIELMISITLGLIILTGVAVLFANTSRARDEIERVSRQIENGRYAIDLLTQDLRLAGFYGELNVVPFAAPAALPDPCSTTVADWNAAIPVHVQGYDGAAGAPASCLPTSLNFQPGTDILVIRRARTCAAGAADCEAAADGKPYLQASLCTTEVAPSYVLGLKGTAAFNLLHKKNCTTEADLRQYFVHIYYVSTDNGAGQNIPTLKRLELTGAGWETKALVEGIEQFNVEYGLDMNGDGAPDTYVADPNDPAGCNPACQLAKWMNVVTVQVHVLSRNLETSPGYTDNKTYHLGGVTYTPAATNYRRHVYSTLVRLANPAGRRDTP
jgi:type IV pilus assembly protein PilW